jgi:hypothetical protein
MNLKIEWLPNYQIGKISQSMFQLYVPNQKVQEKDLTL